MKIQHAEKRVTKSVMRRGKGSINLPGPTAAPRIPFSIYFDRLLIYVDRLLIYADRLSIYAYRLSIYAYRLSIYAYRLLIYAYRLLIERDRFLIPTDRLLIDSDQFLIPIDQRSIDVDQLSIDGDRQAFEQKAAIQSRGRFVRSTCGFSNAESKLRAATEKKKSYFVTVKSGSEVGIDQDQGWSEFNVK